MKKALIDPQANVQHIIAWQNHDPIYETYSNSCRVCEISELEFEVAAPLFWVDCADNVIADCFWYNSVTREIKEIVNEPMPPSQAGISVTVIE